MVGRAGGSYRQPEGCGSPGFIDGCQGIYELRDRPPESERERLRQSGAQRKRLHLEEGRFEARGEPSGGCRTAGRTGVFRPL